MLAVMTVSDVIEALGGTYAAAEIFGVVPSAVSNWRGQNRFPARMHYRVLKECERRQIALDEALLADDAA